jgi:hypothetical protein
MTYQTIATFLDDPSQDDGSTDYINRLESLSTFLSKKRTVEARGLLGGYREWKVDKWLALYNRVDAILTEHYDSDDDSWVVGLGDAPIY